MALKMIFRKGQHVEVFDQKNDVWRDGLVERVLTAVDLSTRKRFQEYVVYVVVKGGEDLIGRFDQDFVRWPRRVARVIRANKAKAVK